MFHLPDNSRNFTIFQSAGANDWQVWSKPQGVNWVEFIVIGSGGLGGAGFSGAAGTARGGGGGGGCGSISKGIFPAQYTPNRLFINIALGSNGVDTFVSMEPNSTAVNRFLVGRGGSTGGTGTASAGGAGGAAGGANIQQNWASLGQVTSFAGYAGSAGGAHTGAVGATLTISVSTGVFLTPGSGGGGTPTANTDFAGGPITGAGILPSLAGGLAAGGRGQDGFAWWGGGQLPIFFFGATGGGTNGAAGVGGAGGDGAVGCGGGGGGAGVTGGAGGKGGNGLVIVRCW